jgi:hypothetical protein
MIENSSECIEKTESVSLFETMAQTKSHAISTPGNNIGLIYDRQNIK